MNLLNIECDFIYKGLSVVVGTSKTSINRDGGGTEFLLCHS